MKRNDKSLWDIGRSGGVTGEVSYVGGASHEKYIHFAPRHSAFTAESLRRYSVRGNASDPFLTFTVLAPLRVILKKRKSGFCLPVHRLETVRPIRLPPTEATMWLPKAAFPHVRGVVEFERDVLRRPRCRPARTPLEATANLRWVRPIWDLPAANCGELLPSENIGDVEIRTGDYREAMASRHRTTDSYEGSIAEIRSSEYVPRQFGERFGASFGYAECFADDIAELFINPISEHEVEGHIRFQDCEVILLEAGGRFRPVDSDGVTTARLFLETIFFNVVLKATATSAQVAPGLTAPSAASKPATSPSLSRRRRPLLYQ